MPPTTQPTSAESASTRYYDRNAVRTDLSFPDEDAIVATERRIDALRAAFPLHSLALLSHHAYWRAGPDVAACVAGYATDWSRLSRYRQQKLLREMQGARS